MCRQVVNFFGHQQHVFLSVWISGDARLSPFVLCVWTCVSSRRKQQKWKWVIGVWCHVPQETKEDLEASSNCFRRTGRHAKVGEWKVSLLEAAHKRLAAKFPRIVPAPSRVEFVEIQGLVHTMGGARANNTGISLQKKVIKMSGRVFLETVTAPGNLFPLIKHLNFLQQFWKSGPKTRRCLLRGEPPLTQEPRRRQSWGAGEVGGPSGGFDELPVKTQKTAQLLQESLAFSSGGALIWSITVGRTLLLWKLPLLSLLLSFWWDGHKN